jgi:hypothetical protein
LVLRFGLAAGWFCLHAPPARAAIIPAINPSYAAVSAAVALAFDGDTVQIPAGTATWNNSLSVDRGITIQGAGATSTVITNAMPGTGSSSQPLFILSNTGTSAVKRITAIGMKGTLITNVFNKQGVGVLVRRLRHGQTS